MDANLFTPVHGHYNAHKLTLSGLDESAFARSLTSARVQMNPHQVEAALFALKSPLSKGVLLADEVGLGKTIEAGLVLSQRWAVSALTSAEAEHLLIALSTVMDEADRNGTDYSFLVVTIWDRAERVAMRLLRQIAPERRKNVIDRVFRDGSAIGWISSLLRHETFAQGRYGDQAKPRDDWMLTAEEYDAVAATMITRYSAMPADIILGHSRPLQILFAWVQAGDDEGPRALIAGEAASDAGLLRALSAMLTKVSSSDRGVYEVIQPSSARPFIDLDAARQRVLSMDHAILPLDAREQFTRVRAAFESMRAER